MLTFKAYWVSPISDSTSFIITFITSEIQCIHKTDPYQLLWYGLQPFNSIVVLWAQGPMISELTLQPVCHRHQQCLLHVLVHTGTVFYRAWSLDPSAYGPIPNLPGVCLILEVAVMAGARLPQSQGTTGVLHVCTLLNWQWHSCNGPLLLSTFSHISWHKLVIFDD